RIVECIRGWRACEQQILERGGLEDTVIACSEDRIGTAPVPARADAGARGTFVNDQTVVIPAEAGVDRQISEAHQVLGEKTLFAILGAIRKRKTAASFRVETAAVDDAVREVFAERAEFCLDSGFPFVPTGVRGDGGLYVRFAKTAVLRGCDRSGERIRPEGSGNVAGHRAEVADYGGREDMLVGNLSGEFVGAAILALAGPLLDQLVGNIEARLAAAEDDSEAVGRTEVAFIVGGKRRVGAGVGEILFDGRVEVAIGARGVGVYAKCVATPSILGVGRTAGSREISTVSGDAAVEAGAEVAGGDNVDH